MTLDYLRDQPIILVFLAIGVLLVGALIFDALRKPPTPTAAAPVQAFGTGRFNNRIELWLLFAVAMVVLALVGLWLRP